MLEPETSHTEDITHAAGIPITKVLQYNVSAIPHKSLFSISGKSWGQSYLYTIGKRTGQHGLC